MTEEDSTQFARSVELIEKLCNETARLRQDVNRLSARIQPFEGEAIPDLARFEFYRKPKTFRDVIGLIEQTRIAIRDCEYAVSKATARVEQIASDGWSREDMKPYLKG